MHEIHTKQRVRVNFDDQSFLIYSVQTQQNKEKRDTTCVPFEYQCSITLINEGVTHRKI